jgi:hypothetical protein
MKTNTDIVIEALLKGVIIACVVKLLIGGVLV